MEQVPKTHSNLRIILPFFIVIIIDAMSIGMIAPILAPLVYRPSGILAGFSLAQRHVLFGVILGIGPICFMLGAPLLGHLSDKFGRKKILLSCIFGTLISFICYYFSFKYSLLRLIFVGRVIDGLTSGSQGVAQAAIADISSGKQKAVNIGVIAVAMTIGLVIGPFIGGVFSDNTVISWFSNTTPFLFAIGLNLLNLLIFFTLLLETKHTRTSSTGFFKQLFITFKQPNIKALLLSFFLFELAWSLYFQSLNLVLVKLFHTEKHVLGIFSLYIGAILSLGLVYLVRTVIKHFPLIKAILHSQLLMGTSFLGLLLLPFFAAQWVFAATIALTVAVTYAGLIAKISDESPAQSQGFILGLTDGILALAFALTGFLSGFLTYYSIHLPAGVCAACMGIAALPVFRHSLKHNRHSLNHNHTNQATK